MLWLDHQAMQESLTYGALAQSKSSHVLWLVYTCTRACVMELASREASKRCGLVGKAVHWVIVWQPIYHATSDEGNRSTSHRDQRRRSPFLTPSSPTGINASAFFSLGV